MCQRELWVFVVVDETIVYIPLQRYLRSRACVRLLLHRFVPPTACHCPGKLPELVGCRRLQEDDFGIAYRVGKDAGASEARVQRSDTTSQESHSGVRTTRITLSGQSLEHSHASSILCRSTGSRRSWAAVAIGCLRARFSMAVGRGKAGELVPLIVILRPRHAIGRISIGRN